MPNLNPVTKNLQVLEELFDLYDAKSIVDWNHNPVPSVLGEVQPMADAGVAAFKIYMVVDTGRDYPIPRAPASTTTAICCACSRPSVPPGCRS